MTTGSWKVGDNPPSAQGCRKKLHVLDPPRRVYRDGCKSNYQCVFSRAFCDLLARVAFIATVHPFRGWVHRSSRSGLHRLSVQRRFGVGFRSVSFFFDLRND